MNVAIFIGFVVEFVLIDDLVREVGDFDANVWRSKGVMR
jgi:hypothetical protein